MRKDLTGGISGEGICSRIGTSPSFVKRSRIYWNWCVSAPGARVYINAVCNYARDEGWPLGVGLQEQASNHLKLHGLRALVVSGGVWTVTSFLQNMLQPSGRYEAHVNLLATSFGDPASVRLLSPLTWLRGPQIFAADGAAIPHSARYTTVTRTGKLSHHPGSIVKRCSEVIPVRFSC